MAPYSTKKARSVYKEWVLTAINRMLQRHNSQLMCSGEAGIIMNMIMIKLLGQTELI